MTRSMELLIALLLFTAILLMASGCSSTTFNRVTPNGTETSMTEKSFMMRIKGKKMSDNYVGGEYMTDLSTAEAGGDSDMAAVLGTVFLEGMKIGAVRTASGGAISP